MFVSKLADADGETAETQVWLDFARDCGYMPVKRRDELTKGYEEAGKMLGTMISMPKNSYLALNGANNCSLPSAF